MLLIVSCSHDSGVNFPIYPKTFEIYLDRDFTTKEATLLRESFNDWEKVGGGSFKFTIFSNVEKPAKFKDAGKRLSRGIFVWQLDRKDNIQLSSNQINRFQRFDGLWLPDEELGYLLMFLRTNGDKQNNLNFKSIALHEIGHLLGMEHTDDVRSIMYPIVGGYRCINNIDAATLCKLYNCSPKPECIIYESEAESIFHKYFQNSGNN